MWGVSKKESFQHQSYDKTWGISNAQQYFPWNTKYKGCKYESIDCTHFYSSNIEVDILFDCDKRKLKLCVVGKLSDNKTNREPSIWNIKHPTDDNTICVKKSIITQVVAIILLPQLLSSLCSWSR